LQRRSDDSDVPLVSTEQALRKVGAALGIIGATLGAGCGGEETLSKEEYVSRVNGMCESFSARENQIGEPRTMADLVAKGPRVLDAFEQTILEEARELDAPDEIAEQAERLVALAEQQRDVLADLIDAAENGQVAEARRLASRNQALNEEANSITRELGAGACAAD
jgi:hypothetical protein